MSTLPGWTGSRPPTDRRAGRAMSFPGPGWKRSERTRDPARWNELPSGHIDEERAERLANHPAFEGPALISCGHGPRGDAETSTQHVP
jgi:hypothetical protein